MIKYRDTENRKIYGVKIGCNYMKTEIITMIFDLR